ncbi:hypothetical protein B0T25DRAFT_554469 [Lasiosphaeria hispida]|uniref:C2H2-type domain-containing protein n=1 Tax=Lasiosphaeria hispida TaxID=260671 RepID=A0AAJ0H855_9PEZI|nr:hypothetical protein B0T25DRAFT_554469 [Lasiosphaeria hispida]
MPDRPATPASRFAARSARGLSVRSSSRPSSLRNAVSAGEGEGPEAGNPGAGQFESQETDTSDSECETAKNSDDESDLDTGDDDNEWSGQNGNLESVVIAAVEGDLGLAAHLIPLLHRDFSLALKSKVESWQFTTTAHGSTSDGSPGGSGAKSSYAETLPDQSPGMSRKRRRTGSDERARKAVGGWDGEDEDEEEEMKDPSPPGSGEPQQLLACPFHKRDSVKYGIQHGNSGSGKKHKYRACTGPGFKSIQRLKEHLKRVHSPVQCERCHEIFPGTDRAACLARLAEHRKMNVSCELGDPSKKEGIDEAQWAALDKQNRRKNQETHRVEKWFEIWDVLFPGVVRPESPWHDVVVAHLSSSSSRDAEHFANLFLSIMDHKVNQGDIDLSDRDNIRNGVKSVAQIAFKAYTNLHGKMSPETSSGESQQRLSLTGGSSARLSDPATTASHQMTATTAATSIASGSHGGNHAPANNYTLNSAAPYGMRRMPRALAAARTHTQPPNPSPQRYMAAPPLPQVASGTEMSSPMQRSLSGFGAMGPGDPAGSFYYTYPMYSPAQGSWVPSSAVGFPPGQMAAMPQDFGMGGATYFGEPQNFGTSPTDGG